MVEICDAGPHHDRYCMAFRLIAWSRGVYRLCRSDHTRPSTMTASGPGGLRKNSPVLTSTILDPSPGVDARARFEAAAQGGGISPLGPLTKPTHPQLDPRSMPLSRGGGARSAAYERGRRTHPRARPWTVNLSKASKLLAKVATIQGYHYQSF
jgi:hypothetical protein